MFSILLLAVSTVAAAPGEGDGPLGKSRDGFVQCYEPDDAAKTCQSMAAYTKKPDGTWDNTATIMLSQDQPVTLETVTPVRVTHGAVCGFLRSDDVLRGKIRFSGEIVPADKAAPALAGLATAMAPVLDKEICTQYVQGEHDLIAKTTMAGGSTPVPDQRVRWIRPADGYTVGLAATAGAAKPATN